ncbi:EAL domain-containing protein [Rhizobium sp. TRM95111]|uniref:bifunctional diguanylate cyclase/phosphodiesterase n=1 Tax=Rhizobium alarense TaxID=2846851 RepID=UPI001F29F1FC|nr:EAL domain-containing protein [Rhizobium alarense]MCF3640171.1 EAL domain-containing protein [Rhizobium alarense]
MGSPTEFRSRLAAFWDWVKPPLLPAAIAACVIVTAADYYERQTERLHLNELKAQVENDLNLVSARLHGEIKAGVTAMRGLANRYTLRSAGAEADFGPSARRLLLQNPQFHRLAIAPGGVIEQIHPLAGNERLVGSDLFRFRSQRIVAQEHRSRGRPVMVGPVQLPDGSRGFNLLLPVFRKTDNHHQIWGYVDGIIDERKLYIATGLIDSGEGTNRLKWKGGSDIQLSIRDASIPDNVQDPFFGDPDVFNKSPVLKTLGLPGAVWELAAIPTNGWQVPAESRTQARRLIAAAAVLIIVPILLMGGLVSERQRNIARLRARENQVQSLSQRLDLALEASKVGIWEIALPGRQRSWDERMYHVHGLPEDHIPTNDEWLQTIHPDDRDRALAETVDVLEGQHHYWSQYRAVLPDGSVRHLRNVGSRLTGVDGRETITGITLDVTEDVELNDRLTRAKEQSDHQNAELEKLTRRLDLALDAYRCGLWEADLDDGLTLWDERMHQLYGVPYTGERIDHQTWLDAIHPEDRDFAASHVRDCIRENKPYQRRSRVVHPDGTIRHIQSVGKLQVTPDGRRKLVGLAFDVTEDAILNRELREAKQQAEKQNADLELALQDLSERERELERTTHRLDLALDSYRCGLWEADLEAGRTYWDRRMHQLYGLAFTDGHVTEEAWLGSIHPDDRQATLDDANHCVEHDLPYVHQARIVLPEGETRHIRSVGKVHRDGAGNRKLIGIAFDVTDDVAMNERLRAAKAVADAKNVELEQAKTRIEHNALHDPLTGLANRRKLDDMLSHVAERSREDDVRLAILHIDLDRFKQINDTLGHAAGDALLVHASEILRTCVGRDDLVARIGGDEFVVLTETSDKEAVADLSGRINALMRQPLEYNGQTCRFGVSIGIATARGRNLDTRQLLVNADIALYRAKALGRNRHEFFTAALQAEIVSNKRIADDILAGIENDEFVPFYQPQIDATTLRLAGAEALIRWNHPRDGLLTPDRFLGIAEDLNVMDTLDRIVLEKALADSARFAAAGLVMPKISVNVSARRLRDETLVNSLCGLSIAPGQLVFELVESIFLDETDDLVLHNIQRIKELGIDIEIDDFGTGHTSIVSLLKLKPKRLKIDRQLVAPILASRHEQALVRSIIEIGRSLGIGIVAEGVETMQHAEMLSMLGCDLLQGYAFARPLPREAFLDFALARRLKLAS